MAWIERTQRSKRAESYNIAPQPKLSVVALDRCDMPCTASYKEATFFLMWDIEELVPAMVI